MTSNLGGPSTANSNYGAVQHDAEAERDNVPPNPARGLHRGLSARQVQMIAIAGTIGRSIQKPLKFNVLSKLPGTGLFLGTGFVSS